MELKVIMDRYPHKRERIFTPEDVSKELSYCENDLPEALYCITCRKSHRGKVYKNCKISMRKQGTKNLLNKIIKKGLLS